MGERKGLSKSEKELALAELRSRGELAELYHEHHVLLPTRTVWHGLAAHEEMLGPQMVERLIKNLQVLQWLGDDPITVVMNNPGGSVYDGWAAYDAIRGCPCDVTVVAYGHAMSMGSIILQAADRRVMAPTAVQLVHYGSDCLLGHSKDVERQADEAKRVNRWIEEMYLARIREKQPGYTLEKLRQLIGYDTFLTAQESVAMGLCDEVLS